MTNNIKILLIGFGYWGKIWAKTIANTKTNSKLLGICDINFSKSKQFLDETLEYLRTLNLFKTEIFPDIFSLKRSEFSKYTHFIVATDVMFHENIVNFLVEKGVDPQRILVEKPIGLSVSGEVFLEHENLSKCFHGFVFLYDELYWFLKANISKIGKIYYIRAERSSMGPKLRNDATIISDYMIHDLYIINDLFDKKIKIDKTSLCANQLKSHTKNSTLLFGADIKFLYNDVVFSLFSSWHFPTKHRELIIVGSEGAAIYTNDYVKIYKNYYNIKESNSTMWGDYEIINNGCVEQMHNNEIINTSLENELNAFIHNDKSIQYNAAYCVKKMIYTIENKLRS